MNKRQLDNYIIDFLNGHEEAFDIIYHETKKYVYLSIYTFFKNQTIIEDIMQDSYMKIINQMHTYKLGTNFYAWVSQIARNTAINEYHQRKKIILVEDYYDGIDPNENSLIRMTMSVLDGLERDVLIYHTVLNMKFKDIANILNRPLPTIYSIYKKAVATMKEYLKD